MSATGRTVPWVIASAAYGALAVLLTWPVAAHLSSAFPHDPFDPALNAWILWWNAHAVPLTDTWWNAPSFWPVAGALAFSEHLLGLTVVSTPLLWAGASPVTAYNIVLLLSNPLTALATHALAFAIVRRHGPAILAGLIMGFSPYRVAHLPHVQMLWVFAMPLALLAAHRYLERGPRSWLIAFGAAWLLLALSNSYYMAFFPVLFGGWILWFGPGSPRRAAAIVAAWLVSSLPLLPIVWTYAGIHRTLNLARRFDEIESFGADITSLFVTTPEMVLWRPLSVAGRGEGQLFPGAIALALVAGGAIVGFIEGRGRRPLRRPNRDAVRFALAGLGLLGTAIASSSLVIGPWRIGWAGRSILSVSSPEKPLTVAATLLTAACVVSPTFIDLWRRRSVGAFYTLAAAAMIAFSWGPHPRLAGTPILFRGPYALLLRLPGLSEVRVPARFGMLAVLCLAIAAAIAFERLTASLVPRTRRILAMLGAAAVIAESWPTITTVTAAMPIAALQRGDLAGPVLELPLGESWLDAPAQFRGILHGRPVVNGYSGYAPPHYVLLSNALRLDDGAVLEGLTTDTPVIVVLNRREQYERWRRLIVGQGGEVAGEEGDWQIYRLPRRQAAVVEGSLLPIRAIEASADATGIFRMQDGNLETIWNSTRVQAGGEQVVVNLDRDRHLAGIRMTFGRFVSDYPRRLRVDCVVGDAAPEPCWNGSIAGLLLRATLDDPGISTVVIPIDRDGVRQLRLTQTAADPRNGWSIAELAILGR